MGSGRATFRAVAALACAAALLAACSASTSASKARFTATGSVDAAYVLGATPGQSLVLDNAAGVTVGRGRADSYGSLVVWNVQPGEGYTVRDAGGTVTSAAFSVLSGDQPPPDSFYAGQHMKVGLNYITMRDGIKLAATLRLPPGKTLADGPFPTVVEYSGYGIAAPGNLISAELGQHSGNPALLPRHEHGRRLGDHAPTRLRDREPADAWHRLLGRSVRPLRPLDDL